MKIKTSRAFSLIELSIVILVIGVLIAGITQASRLIKQFQLTTARTLTASSSVASIKGLVLWLDATSETTLTTNSTATTAARTDGDLIYNWDDQSLQSQIKLRFSQSTSAARPVYLERGINNIPTLFFDAADTPSTGDAMATASYSSTLNPAEFTFFVVIRPVYNVASVTYVIQNAASSKGFAWDKDSSHKFTYIGYNGTSSTNTTDSSVFSYNTPYIYSIYTSSTAQGTYRNGTLQGSSSISHSPNTSALFTIGCYASDGTNSCFDGHISEIIMFDNVLSNADRKDVEKYLSKKYAIVVAP